MKSTVILTTNPLTGSVFTPNTNEDGTPRVSEKDGKQYGFIRLEQTILDLSSPVIQTRVRSALKSIAEDTFNKTKDFLKEGMEFKGQILRIESLEEKQGFSAKKAGDAEDAPVCTIKGQPIYQSTVYTEDMELVDETITHDNTDEIKAYQAALKVSGSLALN